MEQKISVILVVVFLVLTLASVFLSAVNKIFLLLGLSMGISMLYSLLAIISSRQSQE
ncbi:MAG: hypothetical protein RMJ81_07670 [Candidatus Kryptonium sp.]|nr:hypothetical protein [Candidatus Kryptonium sp.]MCX7761498.1 hypothetical protein [Candidatus Kryptonium sp.]MDW8109514.1 hypothetical protein [Candidatus Kryptonium sp.]